MGTLVVVLGLNCSAKKTVTGMLRKKERAYVVSRKEFRKAWQSLTGLLEEEVNEKYYEHVNESLLSDDYTVVDDKLISAQDRKVFFDNVKIPKGTKVVGVWVEGTRSSIAKSKSSKFADEYFKKRRIPKKHEGFDDIIDISCGEDESASSIMVKVENAMRKLKNL